MDLEISTTLCRSLGFIAPAPLKVVSPLEGVVVSSVQRLALFSAKPREIAPIVSARISFVAVVSITVLTCCVALVLFNRWRHVPTLLETPSTIGYRDCNLTEEVRLAEYNGTKNINRSWQNCCRGQLLRGLRSLERMRVGEPRVVLSQTTEEDPNIRVREIVQIVLREHGHLGFPEQDIDLFIRAIEDSPDLTLSTFPENYHSFLQILFMLTPDGLHDNLREELITPFGLLEPCYSEVIFERTNNSQRVAALRITHLMTYSYQGSPGRGRIFVKLKHQSNSVLPLQGILGNYSLWRVLVGVPEVRMFSSEASGVSIQDRMALRQFMDVWNRRAEAVRRNPDLGFLVPAPNR